MQSVGDWGKTFIISGNHDSDDRLNYGSSLFKTNQIYISSKYNGILDKYMMEDAQGEVNIYLLPFVKAAQVRHFSRRKKLFLMRMR